MKRVFCFLPLAAALMVGSAQADDVDANPLPPTETSVRLLSETERLSNNTSDWRDTELGATFKFKPRQVLDLAVHDVRRFGLQDNQFAASYSTPLSSVLTATVDGNASTTHRVLAQRSVGGELQYEFSPAWLVHGGVHNVSYEEVTVNKALFSLEHYFSSFSWTIGWQPTRAYGTTANGLEVRGSYYYGDKNVVTLLLSSGKEAASVPSGVVLTDVDAAAVFGRHWLDNRWAVTYGASHTSYHGLYSRTGVNLGVQYAF